MRAHEAAGISCHSDCTLIGCAEEGALVQFSLAGPHARGRRASPAFSLAMIPVEALARKNVQEFSFRQEALWSFRTSVRSRSRFDGKKLAVKITRNE